MPSGREARVRLELSRRMEAMQDRNDRQKRAIDRLTLMNIEAMSTLFQVADATVPKLSDDRRQTIEDLKAVAKDSVARIVKIRETAAPEPQEEGKSGEPQDPTPTEEMSTHDDQRNAG